MPVVIVCVGCQRKLQVPDSAVGKNVRCPSCGQTILAVAAPTLPIKKITLTVHFQGQQSVVVVECAVDRSLAAILQSGLQQLKPPPPFVSAVWHMTYQGRALDLAQSLAEQIPGIDGLSTVALEARSLESPPPPAVAAPAPLPRAALPAAPAPAPMRVTRKSPAAESVESMDQVVEEDEGSQVAALEDYEAEAEEPVARRRDFRDDDDDRPRKRAHGGGSGGSAAPRTVERNATVRYYNRMNPHKMFPLRVIISRRAIQKAVKKAVAQAASEGFEVAMGSDIEVEPILPGCACYPPLDTVRVQPGEVEAVFWVVPQVLGRIMHARVVLRQDKQELAVIPLTMTVSNQLLTVILGVMGFLLPAANVLLKHFGFDLHAQQSGIVAKLMDWLFTSLSPELLALPFLAAAVGMYLWLRPRQRDVFWDLETLGPAEELAQARQAFKEGEVRAALAILADVRSRYRRYQPAWLLAGEIHFHDEDFDKALECYEQGLMLGKAKATHYSHAALAASRSDDTPQAYAILQQALEILPAADITPVIHYNLGCYAARLGKVEEAMASLEKAVQSGYSNLAHIQDDPDLAPLRDRSDFQILLARLR